MAGKLLAHLRMRIMIVTKQRLTLFLREYGDDGGYE
jgi:hypothetical protein